MKKILALAMAALMIACFATVAFAAPADQVAYYAFDAEEAGLTASGEVSYADGAVVLGAEGFLTSDVNLVGATELTVAFRVMTTDTDANWPFEITSEEAHSWPNEHYIGVLLNAGFTVERYNNAGARPANATAATIPTGEWFDMVCVFPADGSIIVYLNGEEVANVPQSEGYDLAIANCIGENPVLQIGKANWGEYSTGTSIDTFAVYTRALAADEVATALEAPAGDNAPQTGFATAALAVVAVLSGAYIVTKKH